MNKHLSFIICALCYLFGGTVSTLLSANLPIVVKEMTNPQTPLNEDTISAWLNAGFLYGWMIGGLLLGIISDRIGRTKTLALSTMMYGIFTLLVVNVQSWEMLLFYRFCAGFGVGGVLLVTTVYISEIWHPDTRSVALGLLAVAFPVGIVLTGAMTAGFAHWQQAFGLGIIPLVLGLVVWFLLPESEDWASLKKQHETVANTSVRALFHSTYRINLLTGTIIFGTVLVGLWGLFSWIPTWVQGLLHGTSDGQAERGTAMMILGMGGIIGGSLSGIMMQRMGSRNTLLFTFMGLTLICGVLFLTNESFSPIVYLEMAILSMFFGISQGALSAYVPALFPTHIRAMATGFCFNICRFFTATAVFFVGALVQYLGGFSNALLTFAITFVIAGIATFYSPETQKKTNTI
jgi:MFS family permease